MAIEIVDLPIKNMWFSIVMLVYRRATSVNYGFGGGTSWVGAGKLKVVWIETMLREHVDGDSIYRGLTMAVLSSEMIGQKHRRNTCKSHKQSAKTNEMSE